MLEVLISFDEGLVCWEFERLKVLTFEEIVTGGFQDTENRRTYI